MFISVEKNDNIVISLGQKSQKMTGKTSYNHRSSVGKKARVFDADGTIIVSPPVLDKPPSSLSQISKDHSELAKMSSGPRTGAGYRLSSRIESLAKPSARWAKPLIRKSAVCQGNRTLARHNEHNYSV